MKKFYIIMISLFLLLSVTLVFPTTESQATATKYPGKIGKKIKPKAGDILITKKKTTRYHTGHSAIVTDKLQVVDIPAPGTKPRSMSLKAWLKEYKVKNVIRVNSTKNAKKAGKWARTYQDKWKKKGSYEIWTNLNTYKKTYCSKIIWQAFYYGADYDLTSVFHGRAGSWTGTSKSAKVSPYDFLKIKKYSNSVYKS